MGGHTFFHSRPADALMQWRNYPPETVEHIAAERELVARLAPHAEVLVETACNDGSHLDVAVDAGIGYLGVDVVPRHVHAGNRRVAELGMPAGDYRFVVGDAGEPASMLAAAGLHAPTRCLIVYPFCIISALPNPRRVAKGLRELAQPFVVTSYAPTEEATAIRLEYYRRCGFTDVATMRDEKGVRLHTPDGLTTVAYHEHVLRELWRDGDAVPVELTPLATAWVRSDLFATATSGPRERNAK